jgi:hypothetical protein
VLEFVARKYPAGTKMDWRQFSTEYPLLWERLATRGDGSVRQINVMRPQYLNLIKKFRNGGNTFAKSGLTALTEETAHKAAMTEGLEPIAQSGNPIAQSGNPRDEFLRKHKRATHKIRRHKHDIVRHARPDEPEPPTTPAPSIPIRYCPCCGTDLESLIIAITVLNERKANG